MPNWANYQYDQRDWGPGYDQPEASPDPYTQPPPMPNDYQDMSYQPTLDAAFQAVPSVAPSAITPDSLGMTGRSVTKILRGSLTNPQERNSQSTNVTVSNEISPWQTAAGIINPLNLIQLPFRALREVDSAIKGGLGIPTQRDAAENNAQILQYGQNQGWQGFDVPENIKQIAERVTRQSDTRSRGQAATAFDPASIPTKVLGFLTGSEYEDQRALASAAQQAKSKYKASLAQSQLGEQQSQQQGAATTADWAPYEHGLASRRGEASIGLDEMKLQDYPEEQSLDRQYKESQIARNLRLGGATGTTPDERMQREQGRAEREREREQGRQSRYDTTMTQRRTEQQQEGLTKASKATSAAQANLILQVYGLSGEYEASDESHFWNRDSQIVIKPKGASAGPVDEPTPGPSRVAPSDVGPTPRPQTSTPNSMTGGELSGRSIDPRHGEVQDAQSWNSRVPQLPTTSAIRDWLLQNGVSDQATATSLARQIGAMR